MTINVNVTDVENANIPLWLISYDLRSENVKNLTADQKDWLRSKRVTIWYQLRWHFNCAPLEKSLWLIRDANLKDKIIKAKDEWLQEYQANGFDKHCRISVYPIKVTEEGYKTFKDMEFDCIMEWLAKIEKALDKAKDAGKIAKKNIQGHTRKFELLQGIFREDFDNTYLNWELAQDTFVYTWETLVEVQKLIID